MSALSHEERPLEPIDVLIVEDDSHDVRRLREAFGTVETNRRTRLHVVSDGNGAVEFLHRAIDSPEDPVPNLVLLALALPTHDGLEVLQWLNDDPRLRRLPVIVLVDSPAPDDIAHCYEAQANACLTKPAELDGFIPLVESIDCFWLSQAQLPPAV